MPRDFGTPEYSDRMTRALATRGRSNLSLDENIVPVAKVLDATGAPYRSSGRRFTAQVSIGAAAATIHLFRNPGPGAIIIDELFCNDARIPTTVSIDPNGTAFTSNPDPFTFEPSRGVNNAWQFGKATSLAINTVGDTFTLVQVGSSTELLPQQDIAQPQDRLESFEVYQSDGIAGTVAGMRLFFEFFLFEGERIHFKDLELVLPVGLPDSTQANFFPCFYLEMPSNRARTFTILGRIFDDLAAPRK